MSGSEINGKMHFNVLLKNISGIHKTPLPFVGVIGFLLHHLQDSPTSIGAVVWVAEDGNGLFQGPHIIFPVHIHSRIEAMIFKGHGAVKAEHHILNT